MLRVVPMAVVGDENLSRDVRQALAKIDRAKIWVEVVNGIVDLRGSVDTAAERCTIEGQVWEACGIKRIINRIEVPSEKTSSKDEIVDQIKHDCSQCHGIDVSKVRVEFEDGVVYLSGEVPNKRLASRAEEVARWTPGVTMVVNYLKYPA